MTLGGGGWSVKGGGRVSSKAAFNLLGGDLGSTDECDIPSATFPVVVTK